MQAIQTNNDTSATTTYALTNESSFVSKLNILFKKQNKKILSNKETKSTIDLLNKHISQEQDLITNNWQTPNMISINNLGLINKSSINTQNIDNILIPEPIANVFKELFGEDLTSIADLMLAPTQKISWKSLQLHTVSDLPAQEWYMFDWNGIIDTAIEHKITSASEKNNTNEQINKLIALKNQLAEILPKNTSKDMPWQETINSTAIPHKQNDLLFSIDLIKRQRTLREALNLTLSINDKLTKQQLSILENNADLLRKTNLYGSAIQNLIRGDHWISQELDPNSVANSYYAAVQIIKKDPRHKKCFDDSIPHQEKEKMMIELDKQIYRLIVQEWEKTLEKFALSKQADDPTCSILTALKNLNKN